MPRGQFLSQLRIRPSYVALVHVDSGEEPAELTSGEFPVRLLRMRHALPACERIRALRPYLVIVGSRVRSWALPHLQIAAHEAGAELLELGPLVDAARVRSWIMSALTAAGARRAAADRRG
jgi:hypothetical protein